MPDPRDAVEFAEHVSEIENDNRVEGFDDLKFRFGDQWPTVIQNSRLLESRPCLTINEVDAFCRQVENQQRQQRPRIKVHAVDNLADPEIAKVIQGLCRHVEVNSDADQAYDTAFMYADTMGWGYFRMRCDYTAEDSFDQDIYIDQIENPFTVYFDDCSSLPDGSDAERCVITDKMKKKYFELEYPGATTEGFIENVNDYKMDWVTKEDIRIAEYYYVERKKQKLVKLSDGMVIWKDRLPANEILEAAGLRVIGDRDSYRRVVNWCKQTSYEILEERRIPGRWIPVIPVYGVSYILNGKRVRQGLVRMAKDPQRMVNFWETAVTEFLALAPKAKWTLAEGQDEGFENEWAQANLSAKPILHYKQTDSDGRAAPPPAQVQPAPPPAGFIQAAMMASQNLKRVLGTYDPAIRASAENKSDKTINAETQQTDVSNYHYYDNLTRSIKHAGRIILDWTPTVWDKRRVVRIIGDDERPDLVTLNEKQMNPQTGAIDKILNDVTVGQYDVVMDTGPGYNSKRQEAVGIFTQMLGTPLGAKIAQVADDIIVRQLDVPGADQIADRLAAANPLSQIDEKSDIPPQAQLMIKQLQMNLQQAQTMIQNMGLELKFRTGIEQMKQEGETKRVHLKEVGKAHDVQMATATKRHDVETRALTAQNVEEIKGLVVLLAKHLDIGQFEKQVAHEDTQQARQAATTESLSD